MSDEEAEEEENEGRQYSDSNDFIDVPPILPLLQIVKSFLLFLILRSLLSHSPALLRVATALTVVVAIATLTVESQFLFLD